MRSPLLLLLILLPLLSSKPDVAFECTARQEEEDRASVAAKEYRYHGAMVRLGLCALQQGTAAKALEGREWLEKAAELGDPEAKNNLAVMYAKGGVAGPPRAPQKAHDLYVEAALEGCADAMHNLGISYDTGRLGGGVVERDPAQAAHWFSQAAEKNHFEATHALALMEVEGRGVDKDLARARRRFKKLAKPEVNPPYPNAHYMLGMMDLQDAMRAAQLQGPGGLEAAVADALLGFGGGGGGGGGGGEEGGRRVQRVESGRSSPGIGAVVGQDPRQGDDYEEDEEGGDDDDYEEDEDEDDDEDDEEGETSLSPEGLVRRLRRGLDLLRAARDMGHPQAKDQLDALESSLKSAIPR